MNRLVALRNMVVVFTLASAACGTPPASDPVGNVEQAITGGQPESGYPPVGCLMASANANSCSCTGTLIAPNLVLTAKHCGNEATFQLGTAWNAPAELPSTIDKQFLYHPEESVPGQHDLQIFHLQTPIWDVRPLPINTGAVPGNGTSCVVTGFGNGGTKYSATVTVAATGNLSILASAIQIVAGSSSASPPGGMPEHGDSGGPLICNGSIAGVITGIDPNTGNKTYATALDSTLSLDSSWITNVAADYVNEPLVAAASWGPNRIDLFARGTDGNLYQKTWDSTLPVGADNSHWYPSMFNWNYIGGPLSGTPEVVTWGPNRLDVFMRGADTNLETDADTSLSLIHMYGNGSSWTTQNLYGVLAAHPSAVSWGPNRIDVFGVGTDGAMYHNGGDGQNFGGWEAVPGGANPPKFLGPVKAISAVANGIDIYAVGTDNVLYHNAFAIVTFSVYEGPYVGWVTMTQPWWQGQWDNLGGTVLGAPAVVSWGGGREDIFVKQTDDAVYQKVFQNGVWSPSQSGFYPMGGKLLGSPAVASLQPQWLTLTGMGADTSGTNEGMQYKGWFNGSQWAPSNTTFYSFGDDMGSGSPTLLAMPGAGVQMFSAANQFTPYINAYSPNDTSDPYGWSAFESLGGTVSW